ncbi:MAG: chemotaxis protein CheX [Desulfurivibrionaceae bacterium]|jgi:CheY-specific phosphatase CheX|nr:chemotaxis protein CheX [Pseudomonadota bacterium]MCG2824837.1 chemotaxis protein CheX [Desulfobulbaceae bacterium]MDP2003197.1 chemotaxis protein CheX [Desulfurivibrionaceae bacterium]PKN22401.1 MAG: chemotaxis protein CheX [Deltaproteobacteria bacterium HGW-Deltaproteobacteria-3]MBU4229049.1 chemotaxis protein CheX [Pseudomonadota bacterium]
MSNAQDDRHSRLVQAIGKRTVGYLRSELGIPVQRATVHMQDVKRMQLQHLTSILSVEADIRMLIAFSFDRELTERVFTASTEGLEIADDEQEMMREETVAELINIIVGNAMGDLAAKGTVIPISPPIIISEAKNITRSKGATFYTLDIVTESGMLSIHFIGPKELFDLNLDYVEKL